MMRGQSEIFVTRASMPPYEEYVKLIKPLWETHWLTNMGSFHQRLEHDLAEYLDVPEISLTVNGHMALELAIQAFEFPEGSEVITTPFTFISTTHAIVRNRLQPVFCDVKEMDGTIDETRIEDLITPKTVAILPVHVYGNVCNVEVIQEIAYKYGLKVIYDAAHAFAETYKGMGIGNYGDVSVFSFHATKVFNTIEGGAVVCKSHSLYEKLGDLKNFGIRGEELVASVGANAKMNEFCAAMGLCNLRHIGEAIRSRKKGHERYVEELKGTEGTRILENDKEIKRNYAYFPVVFEDSFPRSRDEIYVLLKENGIHARKYFYPLTADQACFKNKYRSIPLPVARKLSSSVLCLPLYEGATVEDLSRVMETIVG